MAADDGNLGGTYIDENAKECESKMQIRNFGEFLTTELKGAVPYFMKVDIEGFEYNVLNAGTEYFKKYGKPKLIVHEFLKDNLKHFKMDPFSIFKWLEEMGYDSYEERDWNRKLSYKELEALTNSNILSIARDE